VTEACCEGTLCEKGSVSMGYQSEDGEGVRSNQEVSYNDPVWVEACWVIEKCTP
jgi:hypothetical protein